ncbi:hypothetical protein ABOM_001850 [Aspergillus bombycis]|uniref:Flavin-containing monooxygenase n=1 Tax=Aspergillus bombycis TaxID=109264 RepID=A0A1F8AD22_9EURO|nr:hypothetical protein ABOM_001850 [Aspergillus bombycis]OGM49640.1 hypothetical protein ABOM_001850 [Aspergillus bombycis]
MSRLEELPCELPQSTVESSVNPAAIAIQFESRLPILMHDDLAAKPVWRDLLALTGTLRTFYTSNVLLAWKDNISRARAHSFKAKPELCRVVRIESDTQWVDTFYSFQTDAVPASSCIAILSLVPNTNGEWKIWAIRTVLDQLSGERNVDFLEPADPTMYQATSPFSTTIECAVIGAGQAGLSTAGRLKALGVRCVVVEQNAEVGQNWKSRYNSAKLHTTREYAHLPFDRTFPGDRYPEFLTKDDLAGGYREWTARFGIDIWLSTKLVSASWDEQEQLWSLALEHSNQELILRSRFLVVAIGAGCQQPFIPTYSNRDKFQGITVHSGAYADSKEWTGLKGVVIGTANTGHDVAEDMVDAKLASVTMLQRSPTYVLPAEYYTKILNRTYNASTPTDLADMVGSSQPFAVSRLINQKVLHAAAQQEPERFDALERAGFRTIRYGDIVYQLFERFGGHYMDVGCSEKIARGLIKVKSDALPVSYTETGLLFNDGTQLDADVIVFATGFQSNLKVQMKDVFGSAIVDKLEDFWGFDDEGEVRGAFKLCGHPTLWFHGGTLAVARYYSRFIALQIKAAAVGAPFEIYSQSRLNV